MLTIYQPVTLVALLSVLNLNWALADQKNYLAELDDEASSLYPDAKTVIRIVQPDHSNKKDKRPATGQLSNGSFLAFMKNEYPASHRVYLKMPIHHKNRIFSNYQLHFDINKSRQEMVELMRNN